MNTFLDMENTFLSIYKEALLKYPNEQENFFSAIELDSFFKESEELLDREVYMMDEIQRMSEKEKDDFISLLALFYFSYYAYELEKEIVDDECDEIIYDMLNKDKKEFLEQVKDPACDYLVDLIYFFIKEQIEFFLEDEDIERGYIEDLSEYNWNNIIESLENDSVQEVFEKFHPNLEEESKEYQRYKKNEYYLDKLLEIPIHSTKDFFTVFSLAKAKFDTQNYLKLFLVALVNRHQLNGYEMSHQIALVILKYYYVENCLKSQESKEEFVFEIAKRIENIGNLCGYEKIIKNFSNFDSLKFKKDLSKLSYEDILTFNKLLTLENRKMYGNKGSWRFIDLEAEYDKLKDTFLRYCPFWIYSLDASTRGNKQMYMYSSEDNNKKHTIPRLCLYVDTTGKIEKIEGRFDRDKIEYEMLDVLKEKLKEFSYPKRISDDINYLTIMANMNKKLDQKEELSLNEIAFLYEINEKVDSSYSYRIESLKEKTDKKKDLARYYGCKSEEVIMTVEELDENTVVYTNSIHTKENECNYPNLRIIMGNLFAECLKSAEGLSSLEEVKGCMLVEDLESSKGLENLIHVGESADFSSMKNTDYLNPDLIVNGSIKLPNKETQKQLQKKFDTVKNNNNSKEEA